MKDTKENARITLVSKREQGEEKDEINFDTLGGYYERDGKFYIAYSEHKDMGMGDSRIVFIDSSNTDYVMSQIRQKYLLDTTVTIVLVGSCTHSRRYVDWEIKTSLRQGNYTPNGLMGIVLPSQGNSAYLPQRFLDNWNQDHFNCYARYYRYPQNAYELASWIEDAYQARTTRRHLIRNSQDMMKYNARCKVCGITH